MSIQKNVNISKSQSYRNHTFYMNICVLLYIYFASLAEYVQMYIVPGMAQHMLYIVYKCIQWHLQSSRGPNGPVLTQNPRVILTFDKNKIAFAMWTSSPQYNPGILGFYPLTSHVDSFYPSNPQLVSISSSPVPMYCITCTCIFLCIFRITLLGTFLKKTHSG